MSDNVQSLVDMGFSEEKSKKALQANNNNLQESLEWLLVHNNDPELTPTQSEAQANVEAPSTATLKLTKSTEESTEASNKEQPSAENLQANSLKCDDCGALLKDEDFATLHAHKTGHVNFSQSTEAIKPKSKEEIEEQKKRLQEKLVKLRQEKQERERQEQIEQEKARRKQGRQINEIKQKHHEDELKRIAEEKRREKIADAAYKQKLRDQIARDREDFKKASKGPEGSNTSPVAAATTPVASPNVSNEKKEYDECRIQVRLSDGKTMTHTFKAKEQLAAVRLWVEMNKTDGPGPFNIIQTFPRKVFTEDDMMRTLVDLGLVPASSLVIGKA